MYGGSFSRQSRLNFNWERDHFFRHFLLLLVSLLWFFFSSVEFMVKHRLKYLPINLISAMGMRTLWNTIQIIWMKCIASYARTTSIVNKCPTSWQDQLVCNITHSGSMISARTTTPSGGTRTQFLQGTKHLDPSSAPFYDIPSRQYLLGPRWRDPYYGMWLILPSSQEHRSPRCVRQPC
jgi:hypothetical protein